MSVERLAAENMPLVFHIVNRMHRRTGGDLDEMVSDGMVGLVRAAKAFDPDRGFKFSTLAWKCIANEVHRGRSARNHQGRGWPEHDGYAPVSLDGLADEGFDLHAEDDPERSVLDRMAADELRAAVDRLPARYRDAVLSFTEKGGHQRLAEREGIHVQTIRNRRDAGRSRLQALADL